MSRRILFFVWLAYTVAFCSLAVVLAEEPSQGVARGLFEEGKADGLLFNILQFKENRFYPVDESKVFQAGDQIKFQYQGNFTGYVYIVNVTPQGKIEVLFPRPGEDNLIAPHQTLDFPAAGKVFTFDKEQGTEVIQVYLAKTQIQTFDVAVRTTNGVLNPSTPKMQGFVASNENQPPSSKNGLSNKPSSLPMLTAQGIISRSVILAPGKKSKKEGTVALIAPAPSPTPIPVMNTQTNQNSRLQPNEVGVFEIRLHHQ